VAADGTTPVGAVGGKAPHEPGGLRRRRPPNTK